MWKSRWLSQAPTPNKPTVYVDVKQPFNNNNSNRNSSVAVWKSRWLSRAPIPNKPTVYVDVKQPFNNNNSNRNSSGAVWKSRWLSWAPIPNKPRVSAYVKQHSTNYGNKITSTHLGQTWGQNVQSLVYFRVSWTKFCNSVAICFYCLCMNVVLACLGLCRSVGWYSEKKLHGDIQNYSSFMHC